MEDNKKINKAIVTGGSAGLGKEIVISLLERGYHVSVIDYNPLSNEINEKYGDKVTFFQVDLSSLTEINDFINKNKNLLTQINTIVLNAAPRIFKPFYEFSKEELIGLTASSYTSSIVLLNSVIKSMISNNRGRIIVISSKSGIKGYSKGSIYCSLKSAWITFHESLQRELINFDVTINTICPDSFSKIDGTQLISSQRIKAEILRIIDESIRTNKSGLHFPALIKTKVVLVLSLLQKIIYVLR
jgi:short-subunit dehydrogenase